MTNEEELQRIVCVGDVMKEVGSLSNVIPASGEMLVLDAGANFGGAVLQRHKIRTHLTTHLGMAATTENQYILRSKRLLCQP